MKKVFFLVFLVLVVFSGCKKNDGQQNTDTSNKSNSNTSSDLLSNMPLMWQDPTYNISFSVSKSENNLYYTLFHSGVFASGECFFEDEKLTMKYPEENDLTLSSDETIKSQQQVALKALFGNEKIIDFVFDKNHYYLFGKGYYVHGDVIFPNYPKQTEYLTDGDTSFYNNMEVTLSRKQMVSLEQLKIYSDPDVNSQELLFSDFKFKDFDIAGYLSKNESLIALKNEKLEDENGKLFIPLLPGLKFNILAKSTKAETIEGKIGHWYAVQNDVVPDYIIHNENTISWIFASDDEVEDYDEAKKLEYTESFIDNADLMGYIEKINFDFSRFKKNLNYFYLGDMEVDFCLYYTDDDLYLTTSGNRKYLVKLNRNQMYVDKDGFLKLKLHNKDLLIIEGEMLTQDFSNFENDGKNDYSHDDYGVPYRGKDLVDKIEATSFYSEKLNGKTINYSPDNLFKCFTAGGCRCHPYGWNYNHIPWVEGADGTGIGESITITFKEKIPGVSILNGFTDISNLKLYKENARVKTLLLEDLTNGTSKEINFKDYAYFNFIEFDNPASEIRLTIKEVYEGTKYSDTCISAIIPHETLYSRQSGDAQFEQFIKFVSDSTTEMETMDKVVEQYGWWFGTVD